MTPNVLLTYKNFAANIGVSHIGLGVSSLNTAKVLKKHGINARAVAIKGTADIASLLTADPTVTTVVIAAPWITAMDFMQNLLGQFPNVEFIVNVHSNVGFLQADTNGVSLIRSYIDLEQGTLNFRISANSRKGTKFVRLAFACPCLYLPNLYYLDYSALNQKSLWSGGILYIGAYGATRPLKNLMTAAGAAILVAHRLKAQTQVGISSGRTEGGAGVVGAIKALMAGLPEHYSRRERMEPVASIQRCGAKYARPDERELHRVVLYSYGGRDRRGRCQCFNRCKRQDTGLLGGRCRYGG